MNIDTLSDIIGWIGAITLLMAYALASTKKLAGPEIALVSEGWRAWSATRLSLAVKRHVATSTRLLIGG